MADLGAEAGCALFRVLRLHPDHGRDDLPLAPVMRRWRDHMAPLMLVDADNRPVEHALRPVFHLRRRRP